MHLNPFSLGLLALCLPLLSYWLIGLFAGNVTTPLWSKGLAGVAGVITLAAFYMPFGITEFLATTHASVVSFSTTTGNFIHAASPQLRLVVFLLLLPATIYFALALAHHLPYQPLPRLYRGMAIVALVLAAGAFFIGAPSSDIGTLQVASLAPWSVH